LVIRNNGNRNCEYQVENITTVAHRVYSQHRWRINGHKGGVICLTGLSGSGKTTLAFDMEQLLFDMGYQAYVLDGDNVRFGLSRGLGFSHQDRTESIRRISEVASLFAEAGFIVIFAFMSPYLKDRSLARKTVGREFHEVFLSADLATCESRDPRGLYAKAHRGEIKNFTGLSAPYEEPSNPEIRLDTGTLDIAKCTGLMIKCIDRVFKIPEC
jgi:adenylyl-sulfate kinase